MRLFCDRAAAVQPGFRLGEDNAEAISAICPPPRRPAPRDRAGRGAGPALRRARAADAPRGPRSTSSGGGARDLPKRQQTLRDAITWSYDLLSADERDGLRLFAVFSDARLTDVEEIAQRIPELGDLDIIEVLGSLVDKSMVRSSQGSDGRPRFSMLQTIRAYATEQLDAIPELADARPAGPRRALRRGRGRPLQAADVRRARRVLSALSVELANVRAAWDEWAGRADIGRLNDLLAPLWGYYDARGRLPIGDRARQRPPRVPGR